MVGFFGMLRSTGNDHGCFLTLGSSEHNSQDKTANYCQESNSGHFKLL
jgi:hypothetical protein